MKLKLTHADIYELAMLHLAAKGFRCEAFTNNPDKTITADGIRMAHCWDEKSEPHVCANEWPIDIRLRYVGNGKKFQFECFPLDPKTHIRAEGKTVADAEESCWRKYRKILRCEKHDFVRGEYNDGHGTCRHCDLLFKFTVPSKPCSGCKANDYELHQVDQHDRYWCETCWKTIGESKIINPRFRR